MVIVVILRLTATTTMSSIDKRTMKDDDEGEGDDENDVDGEDDVVDDDHVE